MFTDGLPGNDSLHTKSARGSASSRRESRGVFAGHGRRAFRPRRDTDPRRALQRGPRRRHADARRPAPYPATRACPVWTPPRSPPPPRHSEACREHPRLARARRLDNRLRPRRTHVPDPDHTGPRPVRAGTRPDVPLAGQRHRDRPGDAAYRPRRRGRPATPRGDRADPPLAGPAPGARRVRRTPHTQGRRTRDPAPDGRPARPHAGPRHPFQRPVLELRRHPDDGHRARHPRPRPPVPRRAAPPDDPAPGLRPAPTCCPASPRPPRSTCTAWASTASPPAYA